MSDQSPKSFSIGSTDLVIRLGTAARGLIYTLAAVMSLPLAAMGGRLLLWQDVLSRGQFLVSESITLPSLLAFAAWIVRCQQIEVTSNELHARFTRYGFRRDFRFQFGDIRSVRFLPGLYGFDGRPRPLIEIYSAEDRVSWVPLPLYQNQQISRLLSALRTAGVRVKESATPRG